MGDVHNKERTASGKPYDLSVPVRSHQTPQLSSKDSFIWTVVRTIGFVVWTLALLLIFGFVLQESKKNSLVGALLMLPFVGVGACYLLWAPSQRWLGYLMRASLPLESGKRAFALVAVAILGFLMSFIPTPPEGDASTGFAQRDQSNTLRDAGQTATPPRIQKQQTKQPLALTKQAKEKGKESDQRKRLVRRWDKQKAIVEARTLLKELKRFDRLGRRMQRHRRAMRRRNMIAFRTCGALMRRYQKQVKQFAKRVKSLEQANAWGQWTSYLNMHLGGGAIVADRCVSCSYDAVRSSCSQLRSYYIPKARSGINQYKSSK